MQEIVLSRKSSNSGTLKSSQALSKIPPERRYPEYNWSFSRGNGPFNILEQTIRGNTTLGRYLGEDTRFTFKMEGMFSALPRYSVERKGVASGPG